MRKSFDIRIFFLSIVYMVLLASVVLPHHHHEEIACYTAIHCGEDVNSHEHQSEEASGHHHDHKAGEESEHCISFEYYITSNNGQIVKRVFDFVIAEYACKHFLNACVDCYEEKPEITANDKLFRFLSIRNTYTVVVQRNIPLRAPPICLA